jgi:hypothetical protein
MNNELLAQIKTLSLSSKMTPRVPVAIFVQEADDLYLWCQDDQKELTHVGLDWSQVELMPESARLCRKFQSQWLKKSKSTSELKKEWARFSSEAINLHSEILHDFGFAFRKDPQLMVKLKEFSSGNSSSKLIQSLNDMAVLGEGQRSLLDVIHFEYSKMERAKELVPLLSELVAKMEREEKQKDETKEMRDKSYAFLKAIVDELKETAKYCLRKNPERLTGYLSDYWGKKNTQRRAPNSSDTNAETETHE